MVGPLRIMRRLEHHHPRSRVESTPRGVGRGKGTHWNSLNYEGHDAVKPRIPTGIAELDRVAGGGLVPGSAILVGGDPGIGKSTLLLQVVVRLGGRGSVYISGEEAAEQVRMRANRLGLTGDTVRLGTATNVRDVLTVFDEPKPPTVIVIDSIQTMYVDTIDSRAGDGVSSANLRPRIDQSRKTTRRRLVPGWTRHQRRTNRRPARARAHGRHRSVFRGRTEPPLSHPSRSEEPLWANRRDRCFRDE